METMSMQQTKQPNGKCIVAMVAALTLTPAVWAGGEVDNISNLLQSEFKDLTADLGAALSYKTIRPEEPMSTLGFNTRYESSNTEMRISNGLPFGFNIGAFYSSAPSSNVGLIGGNLSYAIFKGGTLSPALSVRGTFSRLTGVDELDLTTKGLELSVSKAFAAFTPYAGMGQVWIDGKTTVGLEDESLTKNKYFLGINFNLGLINLAAETEQTGDNTSTSAKIGVRF